MARADFNPLDLSIDEIEGLAALASNVTPNLPPERPAQDTYAPAVTTVTKSLPAEARALLDTIATDESPDYNTIYGGRKFDDYSQHPNIHVPIRKGPHTGAKSSAAGRYQFVKSTWDDQAAKLGLKDFSPESQDRAAWNYAQEVYNRQSGRDLLTDLRTHDPKVMPGITSALSKVWTSMPGGIEQRSHTNKFLNRYIQSLSAQGDIAQEPQGPTEETYDIPLSNGQILTVPKGVDRRQAINDLRAQGMDVEGVTDHKLTGDRTLTLPDSVDINQALVDLKEQFPDQEWMTQEHAEKTGFMPAAKAAFEGAKGSTVRGIGEWLAGQGRMFGIEPLEAAGTLGALYGQQQQQEAAKGVERPLETDPLSQKAKFYGGSAFGGFAPMVGGALVAPEAILPAAMTGLMGAQATGSLAQRFDEQKQPFKAEEHFPAIAGEAALQYAGTAVLGPLRQFVKSPVLGQILGKDAETFVDDLIKTQGIDAAKAVVGQRALNIAKEAGLNLTGMAASDVGSMVIERVAAGQSLSDTAFKDELYDTLATDLMGGGVMGPVSGVARQAQMESALRARTPEVPPTAEGAPPAPAAPPPQGPEGPEGPENLAPTEGPDVAIEDLMEQAKGGEEFFRQAEMAAPEMAAPEMAAPEMAAPEMAAPMEEIPEPTVRGRPAPEMADMHRGYPIVKTPEMLDLAKKKGFDYYVQTPNGVFPNTTLDAILDGKIKMQGVPEPEAAAPIEEVVQPHFAESLLGLKPTKAKGSLYQKLQGLDVNNVEDHADIQNLLDKTSLVIPKANYDALEARMKEVQDAGKIQGPEQVDAGGRARPQGGEEIGYPAEGGEGVRISDQEGQKPAGESKETESLGFKELFKGAAEDMSEQLRAALWQGYSENGAGRIDPIVQVAHKITEYRKTPFNEAEFRRFAEEFGSANTPEAKVDIANKYATEPRKFAKAETLEDDVQGAGARIAKGMPLVSLVRGDAMPGIKRFTPTTDGLLGQGIYFTEDSKAAKGYGPHVTRSDVVLRNPLVIDGDKLPSLAAEHVVEAIATHPSMADYFWTRAQAKTWARQQVEDWAGIGDEEFPQMLRGAGHDGVVLLVDGKVMEATALHPDQVHATTPDEEAVEAPETRKFAKAEEVPTQVDIREARVRNPDQGALPLDVNKFTSTANGKDLLEAYLQHGTHKELKGLAQQLLQSPHVKNVGASFVQAGDTVDPAIVAAFRKANGVTATDPSGSTVYYRKDAPDAFTEHVLVHEVVHGLTTGSLLREPHLENSLKTLSYRINDALSNAAKDPTAHPDAVNAAAFWNEVISGDAGEALAYGLTSPTFRQLLSQYTADGQRITESAQRARRAEVERAIGRAPERPAPLTLWHKFTDFFRKLAGIPEKHKQAFETALETYHKRVADREARIQELAYMKPALAKLEASLQSLLKVTEKEGIGLPTTKVKPNRLYSETSRESPKEAHSTESLNQHIKDTYGKTAPRVEVSTREAEGVEPNVKGFYDPDTKRVVLIADNIGKDEDIHGLMRHEVAVHARRLGKSDPEFKAILDRLEALRDEGNSAVLRAYERVPKDTVPENVHEEALAYLTQHAPTMPVVKSFMSWMRRMAHKLTGSADWLKADDFAPMADAILKQREMAQPAAKRMYSIGEESQRAVDHVVTENWFERLYTPIRTRYVSSRAPLEVLLGKMPLYDEHNEIRANAKLAQSTRFTQIISNALESGYLKRNAQGLIEAVYDPQLSPDRILKRVMDMPEELKDRFAESMVTLAQAGHNLRGAEMKAVMNDALHKIKLGQAYLDTVKDRYEKAASKLEAAKELAGRAKGSAKEQADAMVEKAQGAFDAAKMEYRHDNYKKGTKYVAAQQRLYKAVRDQFTKARRDESGRIYDISPAQERAAREFLDSTPELKQLTSDIRELFKHNAELLRDSNVISEATFKSFTDSKYNYSPLYMSIEDLESALPAAGVYLQGGQRKVMSVKGLKGGKHQAEFFQNLLTHQARVGSMALHNNARLAAAETLAKIGRAKELPANTTPSIKQQAIAVIKDGKRHYYLVDDKPLYDAFEIIHNLPLPEIVTEATKFVSRNALVNPRYWWNQLVRDPFIATMSSRTGIITPFHAGKEFASLLFSELPDVDTKTAELYRETKGQGVTGSHEYLRDLIKEKGKLQRSSGVKAVANNTKDLVMRIHEYADAATKVAVMRKAIKMAESGRLTGTPLSGQMARDAAITHVGEMLNFANKGRSATVRYVTQTVPFFNSWLQGMDALIRNATGYGMDAYAAKQARWMFTGHAAALAIFSAAITALRVMFSEDYRNAEPDEWAPNWLIPIPETFDTKEGRMVKGKGPFELNTLFKLGPEMFVRNYYGLDRDKRYGDILKQSIWRDLAPPGLDQFFVPYLPMLLLEGLTGYRLSLEEGFKKPRPLGDASKVPEMRGRGESPIADVLSMDTFSPASIKHVGQGVFGGLYDMLDSTAKGIASTFGSDTARADLRDLTEKVPVISGMLTNPDKMDTKTAYDFADEQIAARHTGKSMRKTGMEGAEEYLEEGRYAKRAAHIKNKLAKVNTAIERLKNSKDYKDADALQREYEDLLDRKRKQLKQLEALGTEAREEKE